MNYAENYLKEIFIIFKIKILKTIIVQYFNFKLRYITFFLYILIFADQIYYSLKIVKNSYIEWLINF